MSGVWKFAYFSDITAPLDDNIDEIIAVSERNNPAQNISGVLFFDRKSYLQVLEGPRDSIADCVLRISADERHSGLRVIYAAPSMIRLFSSWGMARGGLPIGRRSLSGYAKTLLREPAEKRMQAIEAICLDTLSG